MVGHTCFCACNKMVQRFCTMVFFVDVQVVIVPQVKQNIKELDFRLFVSSVHIILHQLSKILCPVIEL